MSLVVGFWVQFGPTMEYISRIGPGFSLNPTQFTQIRNYLTGYFYFWNPRWFVKTSCRGEALSSYLRGMLHLYVFAVKIFGWSYTLDRGRFSLWVMNYRWLDIEGALYHAKHRLMSHNISSFINSAM